ncbi:hypothetical protein BCR33DRAFT_237048 [Rhizoclosmatium globosum]|uniref:Uncharacterized protein n=1 Tax=Rhizoclosmatium globosum TaxID=329046 RepID=A0A1Y2CB69_9FUNG|nr:hypothetical protein BCR33DRAFT_237048 [Rhizoclosmatium globosum]|eukprot:ORY44186.1 hypothetical protein BCR33DRAFT_237048 [Rhizoclosmatium globosum]
MVRVRRTSHFYKKFRSMTKQKRSLGTTVKRFEEIDSASEISGTGECRRKSSNAFAGIVQANAKYLDMQRRVQERADRIMMQIEAGDLASQRQSTVRQSVAQSVFDEDDEETDKRSLNPLRYRIRDRAQVKLRTENVTANALESSTAELWSQYLRVKDIVEAKYPQVKQSLVAFSESELRSKIRKLIGLARIRTSEPPSTAPVISTSKSIEPTRTQRVSIITPPSPLQTSPTSTASPLCQSTTPPQTFEFQLESQLEYPISECQSEIEACILLEPDSIISNNAITARKSQTQPFRFVKPRSRTSTVSPLPMRILEGTVSDNAELPISLVLRQSSPSAADQEDNPPLLRKSIMRNSRSSATRRTSVTVGPSCIQAQDFELLEETFMTSKPSSLTQRYGRKSIAAVPEDDATYTFPNSSSKRISRVSSTSERRESKSERKSITSAANSLTEKRLLKKLSKIQTLVNKKVALREDRVLKALSELDKSITVQSIIQLVKRSDDELQLIRVKG